ncbi:hypothetical protein J7643_11950 [bacterium]|nr:hypothetical protein [bacterium]
MTSLHRRAFVAALLASTVALPAMAAPELKRLENSLTAGGLNIAPRYLDKAGDIDMNLLGGVVNYPSSEASLVGGQISFQARLTDRLLLLANMGPLNEIGLRGPLAPLADWSLGWAAHYRSDLYFTTAPTTGLASPMGGYMPGSLAQGLELKLNGMRTLGGFNLYLSPLLAVMSNRTMAGAEGGIDWTWERLGLGYGLSARSNVVNAAQGAFAIAGTELQHSAGIRFSLNNASYLQANYYYAPNDTYGLPVQTILAGIGTRLFYSAPAPAKAPEPAPVPTPAATPVPAPTPAPAVSPVPAHFTHLEGRLFSSMLPGGAYPKPLIAALKRKVGNDYVNVAETATTDANGRYVFHNVLEEGEYQVVFRNPEMLPNTVGVAVSEAVQVLLDRPVFVDMDLAWDDVVFEEPRSGALQSIHWGLKPGYADAVYQGVLREDPDDSRTDILPFPSAPTVGTKGSFGISGQIKGKKLYHFVKYWKQGGKFRGSSYYGQSKPRVLQLP